MNWKKFEEQIKDMCQETNNIQKFFDAHVSPERQVGDNMMALCPFPDHADSNYSFGYNISNGLWRCMGCHKKGNLISFVMQKEGIEYIEAIKHLATFFGVEVPKNLTPKKDLYIDPEVPAKMHKALLELPDVKAIVNGWGISDEAISLMQIGFDVDTRRISFPMYDVHGTLRNIRLYDPHAPNGQFKTIGYKDANGITFNEARIFNEGALLQDTVLLCEGEKDTAVAVSNGFNACSVTGGAGTWKKEWNVLFKDKNVIICYDNDPAGVDGAQLVVDNIAKIANVSVLQWPEDYPAKGDVTDYFSKHNGTTGSFSELLDRAKPVSKQPNSTDVEPIDLHLAESSDAKYTGEKVRIPVIVSGKDFTPFIIPKTVRVSCDQSGGKRCLSCGLLALGGSHRLDFGSHTPEILKLLVNEDKQKSVFRDTCGIPKLCTAWDIDIIDKINVEEVSLIPQLSSDVDAVSETAYVNRTAYFLGHNLPTNQSYKVEGFSFPHPETSYATVIVDNVIPAQDTLGKFEVTPETVERLKKFQPKAGQSVLDKFIEIHTDLERNVTQIWQRKEVAIACDLVWHSAISFNFQGKSIDRGWVQALIYGDTGQGKSEVAQLLLKHYRMGDFIDCKNARRTGLTYAIAQTPRGSWYVDWGKLALNDRGLLVADELAGMEDGEMEKLTTARSSGKIIVTGVKKAVTDARTRLLMLSNPKTRQMTMSQFSYGIQALNTIFSKPEDIRRLDFALAVASDDLPPHIPNTPLESIPEVEHTYTTELCKDLILWAWTRRPEHIVFDDLATAKILEYAQLMGDKYVGDVMLVISADQRHKLARLAVATACRLFSTDNGENVVVRPEHVDFVYEFLCKSYDNPNMAYDKVSDRSRRGRIMTPEMKAKLREDMTKLEDADMLVASLSDLQMFSFTDMMYQMAYDPQDAKKVWRWLNANNLIEKAKARAGYVKTPAGIQFLRYMEANPIGIQEAEF